MRPGRNFFPKIVKIMGIIPPPNFFFSNKIIEDFLVQKYSNCVRIYFSCFTKVCNMQNTLELFWFTIDSSGLPHEGVQFFFHDICRFFVCIADSTKLYKRIIK